MRMLLALFLSASPAWAGAFEPPPVGEGVAVVPLHELAAAGLARIARYDAAGLGAEAGKAAAWAEGRAGLAVRGSAGSFALADGAGESTPLSDALGLAVRNLNSYFGLTVETMARPVAHDEIKAAFLSESGVAAVAGLYETVIAGRVRSGSDFLFPEIGGESTLAGGEFRPHQARDPSRPALLRLSAARESREGMIKVYEENRAAIEPFDEGGYLWRALTLYPERVRKGHVSPEHLTRLMLNVLDEVVARAGDSFTSTPKSQLEILIAEPWVGRYLGRWHVHPPRMTAEGWRPIVAGPSDNDMEIARRSGQNLTIEFHPEGFDVFDLAPLAGAEEMDPSRILSFGYRSPAWRERFQALWERINAGGGRAPAGP